MGGRGDGGLGGGAASDCLARPLPILLLLLLHLPLSLLPLLVLYALLAGQALAEHWRPTWGSWGGFGVLAAFLALVLPVMGFLLGRAGHADPPSWPYRETPVFYREPTLAQARHEAARHLALRADLRRIGESTRETDRIMIFEPNVLALLAHRRGMRYPSAADAEPFRRLILAQAPDYLYLSALHPRRTRWDGLSLAAALDGIAEPLWVSYLPDGVTPAGIFYRRVPSDRAQAAP